MKELIIYALSGFWRFWGFVIIFYIALYFPTNLILQIIHKAIRAKTIRMKGYPPQHCDGDGDFNNSKNDKL